MQVKDSILRMALVQDITLIFWGGMGRNIEESSKVTQIIDVNGQTDLSSFKVYNMRQSDNAFTTLPIYVSV